MVNYEKYTHRHSLTFIRTWSCTGYVLGPSRLPTYYMWAVGHQPRQHCRKSFLCFGMDKIQHYTRIAPQCRTFGLRIAWFRHFNSISLKCDAYWYTPPLLFLMMGLVQPACRYCTGRVGLWPFRIRRGMPWHTLLEQVWGEIALSTA